VEPPELRALLATLDETDPWALTSCPGWTAHHLAAHIAGNYEEVRRHVEAHNRGTPLTQTRSWEEREESWRELAHGILLRRLVDETSAAAAAIAEAVDARPGAELAWTNRTVKVAGFSTHMRSEDALHSWDIAGDDDLSRELLGQPDLLAHAVTFIGGPLCQRGLDAGAGRPAFTARLRSPGHDDLVVEAGPGIATLTLESPRDEAAVVGDAAARLLLLWGRKPSPFARLRQAGGHQEAIRVQALLTGY
jgi:Mycothiol maleylpyruvate isomerase N-terminal domain